MTTTLGFGTENVVFVPKGRKLQIYDAYRWRVTEIDVLRSNARVRAHASEAAELRIEEALQHLKDRKRKSDEFAAAAESIRADLQSSQSFPNDHNVEQMTSSEMTYWLRMTDRPAESFFAEDYEEAEEYSDEAVAIPVFGSMHFSALEDLEIPFPSAGKQAAFDYLLPAEGGLIAHDAPLTEPLPLVTEYCGAGGVSANGWSVNLDLRAAVHPNKNACVPVRRIAEGLFATLYFTQSTIEEYQITTRVNERLFQSSREVLEKLGFLPAAIEENYLILQREGDVIHFYRGLEGKESAGTSVLPAFVIVAAAAGSLDPAPRSELLREIEKSLAGAIS